MNCELFLKCLDEGGEAFLSAPDSGSFRDHAGQCPACKAALAAQSKIQKQFSEMYPSRAAISSFNERTLSRIRAESAPHLREPVVSVSGAPSPGREPAPGIPFFLRWVSVPAFAAGLGIILFLGFWGVSPTMGPRENSIKSLVTARLSGDFTLTEQGKAKAVFKGGREIPVGAGTKIGIETGSSCQLALEPSGTIKITGEGSFGVDGKGMQIYTGKGTFIFSLVPRGFEVRTPLAAIFLMGTVVHISLMAGADEIWVEEGKVSWEFPGTNAKGFLSSREGLRFSSGPPTALKNSPLASAKSPVPKPLTTSVKTPVSTSVNAPDSGPDGPAAGDSNAGFLGGPEGDTK